MRILGIDPGITRCGVGIIEVDDRRTTKFIGVDVIRTSIEFELPTRLMALGKEIEDIIQAFQPDSVAIERVFSQHNVRSAMDTASASAVSAYICANHNLPISIYTPTEVKAAVTGNGRADKSQVTAMVTKILRLTTPPKPADAADALALAICHAWRGIGKMRLQGSSSSLAEAN